MAPSYNPDVFNVRDFPQARQIILTPEDSTTDARWQRETPHVCDLIGRTLDIKPGAFVLDYGCGIGRIAKELIARHGCHVIGVDISPGMRVLSNIYVESERFTACTPGMLAAMSERGFHFDAAVAILVLQHCPSPAHDIARLRAALAPSGRLFVLNGLKRSVPTHDAGWFDDRLDIKTLLTNEFAPIDEGHLAADATTDYIAQTTFWATFAQRTAQE
jgi:cyclopropane fatty-acyl-phospholipid synthase-like methyltransferase